MTDEDSADNKSVISEQSALFDPSKQSKVRERVQRLREKNIANQKIRAFRNLLSKKDTGKQVQLTHEKMQALPGHLKDDPDEALLYLYYSVRYYDEQMFKVILQRTNNLSLAAVEVQLMFKDARSFHRLTTEDDYDRFKLNQLAFEVALDKDYMDVAYHFIENGLVQITWEMIRKMLANRQEYLVK